MRKHPVILGLCILAAIGLLCFLVIYGVSSLTGDRKSFAMGEKIGVAQVEGVLYDGKPVIDQLDDYERDDDIRAVVLRINSPGGAIVPSQEIYEKVLRVREKKRVVVSMGSVAASGGYYIACAADRIVANPGTITGSIGVIIQHSQFRELLDKIGIEAETVKTGKYKDTGSPLREMTADDEQLLQDVVDDIFDQFIGIVSMQRNISEEQIRTISDARIFTGRQALKLGLVDELGDMEHAVTLAVQLAGIEGEPELVYPRKERKGLIRYFLEEMATTISALMVKQDTGIRYLYTGESVRGVY